MKAISLWQPWATAVAFGSKRVETRHWSTRYRGPLAIHAAKRINKSEFEHYGAASLWRGALAAGLGLHRSLTDLPFGAIVATCRLADVRPSTTMGIDLDERRWPAENRGGGYYDLCWTERDMGNFEPGRFGWVLEDVLPTRWPIPFRGMQGLFDVPDELLATERA